MEKNRKLIFRHAHCTEAGTVRPGVPVKLIQGQSTTTSIRFQGLGILSRKNHMVKKLEIKWKLTLPKGFLDYNVRP